ncbi:hypothetical protein KEF29_28970 [Streptomyces tuirus]|uniref:DUF5753 domain-containing protein n=1 Tax=Streptomyces tuirus TaxID=68278 RepID=A0A941FEZ6_9ACTN|nr:hypothetical protein [Streptomyces tuirus]
MSVDAVRGEVGADEGVRRRGLYLDDAEDVSAYKLTFDYLRSQAADTTSSLRLIAGARRELSS